VNPELTGRVKYGFTLLHLWHPALPFFLCWELDNGLGLDQFLYKRMRLIIFYSLEWLFKYIFTDIILERVPCFKMLFFGILNYLSIKSCTWEITLNGRYSVTFFSTIVLRIKHVFSRVLMNMFSVWHRCIDR
jgi:hypothetical protein